ncbi:MAG: DUF167 domain-containing protein [Nanoarchaeota archaeon]|nr:DUF167 domain-containing protein [Nanoarchaeota archaeon]MBU1135220.1 DUF167 domain-containing protein [Nanoarchaeota archaeon]MBU2519863.1 DUF167 domain-containing protein [Nanoarchaeota archaeon]
MEVDALFKIKVKTGAKEFKMRVSGLTLFLDVKSLPMEGGANREIIKELKKIFKRPVGIVKGHKSKDKVILVKNLMPEDAKKILDQCERAQEPTTE